MIAEMMMRSKFRRILLAGSAAFTVTIMPAATALAQAQVTPSATQVRVDIPAGSLSEALIALGQQADVQIAFLPDRVVGRRVKALKGTMTTEQALQRLLSGTLLRYRSLRPGSYVVGGPTDANVREARKTADEASAGSGFVNGKVGIPEILVIGRRTMTINTDIPRTENEAQPYTVFTSEEIKRSGSVNLEDFFRDNLGQNVSVRTALQGGGVTGRDSQINLRGLGLDATLILVDGRRFAEPNNGITGAFTQSSLAGIPLEQIERIEVLASSAAGQYGSNAVGGVINIILKRDFKGVELNSYLGSSTRGDAREYRLSANATVPILPGTSLSLSANWKKSDPLFGADRQFLNERLDFILANNPNFLNTTTQLIYGSTPNIRAANGGNLVLKSQYAVNGVTALNSPVTFIPTGYPGIATAGAAALLQNAGKQNSDPSPVLPAVSSSAIARDF